MQETTTTRPTWLAEQGRRIAGTWRAHRALRLVVLVVVALAINVMTWPSLWVSPQDGLDGSWQIGLHLAADHGLAFGRDIGFTYGPLGFLVFPLLVTGPTYALAFVATFVIRTLLILGLVVGGRRAFGNGLIAVPIAYAAAALFFSFPSELGGLLALVVALLFLQQPCRTRRWALIASGLMSIAVFANLNRVHDYYQLPYYPTIALLGGLGVWSVGSLALRISRERAIQLTAGILAGLAMGWTITLFHSSYFADAALDMATLGTATELAQHTPDQPLLYLADGADPNEPMVLYEARRLGWRVATSDEAQAKQRVAAATDLGAIAVQKGAGGVPAWVAPLAATKGFHLSWDGPTFAIYSK